MRALIGLGLGLGGLATPAAAQIWLGQIAGEMAAQAGEHQCMLGRPQSDKEVREAAEPATASLIAYHAGTLGGQPAQVAAAFHPNDSKARVRSGGAQRSPMDRAAIRDPLATPGSVIDRAPVWFTRAADSGTAMGAWRVRDRAGRPIGWYQATFRRRGFVWKAREIESVAGTAQPAAVTQYCHKPGDAVAYRAKIEADEAKRVAKKAAKAAAWRSQGS